MYATKWIHPTIQENKIINFQMPLFAFDLFVKQVVYVKHLKE